jgi:hypothetical protein
MLIAGASVWSSAVQCPLYPSSAWTLQSDQLALESRTRAFSLRPHESKASFQQSANFIDDYIFGKMASDGVDPSPPATDSEILRRLSLDLTGRIPTSAQVISFVNDADPNKRSKLVDSLLSSDAFVDYWTLFFGDKFQVSSRYYDVIGIPGRGLFYTFLRNFVAQDRSYRDFVTELITASGDSHLNAALNFSVRAYQIADPIQDTWDALTDRVTTLFLGVQTQCVSCHDGAHHLEPINTYLASRRREDFWKQSAFLSRTSWAQVAVDAPLFQSRMIINDRKIGAYTGVVDPQQPGVRPARSQGPYYPQYFFNGETPQNDNWRSELARLVTSDRQFARATVNYLWAHFFRNGIVDPPDGWDLGRIDPKNPPPQPWALQPTHPELLEALADEFIKSNYSIRHIIQLIAQSNAYQLSSKYPSGWKPEFERYFARHLPRRLLAEEIYDAVITATGTERAMQVEGFDKQVIYATQLPDPAEPLYDDQVRKILENFGRGDWLQKPRSNGSGIVQVLFMMNDPGLNSRSFGDRSYSTRVSQIMLKAPGDAAAIQELFLSTLGRSATDDEVALLISGKGSNYAQWLSDIQWALLNKVEFLFNN